MDAMEMRRVLQLYFIDCLYTDEHNRALAKFRTSISEDEMLYEEMGHEANALRRNLPLHLEITSIVLPNF